MTMQVGCSLLDAQRGYILKINQQYISNKVYGPTDGRTDKETYRVASKLFKLFNIPFIFFKISYCQLLFLLLKSADC